jgi:hypothetical protein
MLTLAEALQSMFGGPAAMDFGKLMKVFGAMQGFRAKAESAGFAFNPNGMLDLSQMPAGGRRPVAVVDGETPEAPDTPAPPRRRPPADPAPGPDAATLRAELQTLLPPGGLCALLDNHPVAGDDGRVDELVAIGSLLVETAEATPGDHLAYAVALTLRDSDDRARAAVHLRTAAGAAPGESPEFLLTALSLAIRLDAGSVLDESFGDVTTALRQIGAGALLVETPGGVLVLTAATGHLEPAAEDRALPERLLVVGTGPIAGRHTVSYVRSAAQVIVLARRGHRPVTADAVFVANPRRDRDRATMDALLLRRAYHPVSAGLGSTVEDVTGAATPDEVAARLDASLVHLGCGITPAGALELAGGTELPATRIAEPPAGARTGGVVLLPPAPAGTPALVDALLARGVSDVIAFREPVPDRVASLIYFLLHGRLVDEGLEPAQAVASVHDWLTDPERTVPEFLPADLRTAFPAYAEVVVCFGA